MIGSEQKCNFSTRYIVEQHDRFVAATRLRTIDPRNRISRDTSRRSTSASPFISSRLVPLNTLSLLSLTLSHSCSLSRFLSLLTFPLIIIFFLLSLTFSFWLYNVLSVAPSHASLFLSFSITLSISLYLSHFRLGQDFLGMHYVESI